MADKKDRGRFTIKLNENDPTHEAAIRLLEQQPPRGKAQLVVDALLQYMRSPAVAVPAESVPHAMSHAEIEAIVLEVLHLSNFIREHIKEMPLYPKIQERYHSAMSRSISLFALPLKGFQLFPQMFQPCIDSSRC